MKTGISDQGLKRLASSDKRSLKTATASSASRVSEFTSVDELSFMLRSDVERLATEYYARIVEFDEDELPYTKEELIARLNADSADLWEICFDAELAGW